MHPMSQILNINMTSSYNTRGHVIFKIWVKQNKIVLSKVKLVLTNGG